MQLSISLKGSLVEHSSSEIIDIAGLEEIQKAVSQLIAADCRRFVRKMQEEFGVDCIDITKFAQAKWRNQIEEQVREGEFINDVRIVVTVKTKITDVGQTR